MTMHCGLRIFLILARKSKSSRRGLVTRIVGVLHVSIIAGFLGVTMSKSKMTSKRYAEEQAAFVRQKAAFVRQHIHSRKDFNDRYVIGIDPGKKTGYAVYDKLDGELIILQSVDFWELIFDVDIRFGPDVVGKVVIEKPSTKQMFHKNASPTMGVNVGMNRREAELLIEWFSRKEYNVVVSKPLGKINKDKFKKITGWQGRTNEHTRDAGMLAYGV